MVLKDFNGGEGSFRRLAENLPGMVYRILIEDDNRVIFFNDMFQTMTGYSPEDLKTGNVCSIDPLILLEDKLNVINIVKDAIENNVPFEVEYRIKNKNGDVKWFSERGRPIRGVNGHPSYIDGVIFDITNRKEAEIKLKISEGSLERLNKELDNIVNERTKKLKESEEKYRLITENVNDIIFVTDQNMNYEYVNEKAYLNIMGRSKEEMIGKDALSWAHPEDAEKIIEVFKIGFESGEGSVEARFKDKKGIYRWFEVKGNTFTDHEGKKKALMISRETTRHKEAEQKILQEREKANLYLNVVEVILVALDRDGKITLLNKKGHELLGYNEGELIGKNWFEECLPPHDRERVDEYFKKLMAGEIELIKFFENPILVKTGEERLISWSAVLFKDENGTMTGLLSSGIDITVRKEKEEEVRLHSEIMTNMSEGVYLIQLEDLIIVYANPRFEEMFGYDPGEMIGKYAVIVNAPSDKTPEEIKDEILGILKDTGEWHGEVLNVKKDGTPFWCYANVSLFDHPKYGRVIVSVHSDITESKKVQEEIKESETRFKSIFESKMIGTLFWNANGFITDANDAFLNMIGYTRNEILSGAINWKSITPLEYTELDNKALEEIVTTGAMTPIEKEYIRKDGSRIPIIFGGTSLPGPTLNGVAFILDITERKNVEAELEESEEKFRIITEQSHMAIAIIQDDVFKYLNQKASEITGYSLKELYSWKPNEYSKFLHSDDVEFMLEQALKKQRGDPDVIENYRYRGIKKTSEIIFIDHYSKTINFKGRPAALLAFVDITDKVKAEKKLEESEEKFRKQNVFLNNILESLTHPFYVINVKDYTVALANSTASSECLEHGQYCYSLTHGNNKPCEAPCLCPVDKVINTKKACVVEHLHYDKDGNEKVYEIYGYPILDENGNVVQMIEYALNITDRKIAQQELKKSEEKYRHLFENSPYYIILLDKDGIYIDCNDRIIDIYGYSKEELIGKNFKEIPMTPPEVLKLFENRIELLIKGDILPPIEFEVIRRDGKQIWVNSQASLIKLDNEFFVYIIGQDITERKKAERKLKESEENYRELALQWQTTFDAMSECVLLLDLESNILQCNQVTLDFLGKKDYDEIIGHSCLEIIRGNSTMEDRCPIMRMLESNKTETSIAQIGKKWCEISANPIINDEGDLIGVVQIIVDITERKKADKALHESEERFRNLIEQSVDGIVMVNEEGKIIEWNKGQELISGLKKEEVLERFLWDIQIQLIQDEKKNLEYYEMLKRTTKDVLKTGDAPWLGELHDIKIRRVDTNENRTLQQLPFLIETKNKIMLGNFARDVTEQRHVQKEIQEKQATLESIFRAAPTGIGMVKNRILIQVNEKFCSIVGYKRDELLNNSAKMVYSSDEEYELVGKEKYDQIQKFGIGTVETTFQRKDGKLIDVLISSVPLSLSNLSGGVTFTVLDITERKKAERELIESEEKFRNIAEQSFMGIIIIQDGLFKYFNQRSSDVNGYSAEEIQNWKPYEFNKLIHPEDRDFVMEQAKKKEDGQIDVVNHYIYRIIKKSGEISWMDNYSKTINYKGRSANLVMTEDITGKILAEQQLKESEEKFRTIAERALMGILILQDNQVKYVNDALLNIFEYSQKEIAGWEKDALTKLIHPEDLKRLREYRERMKSGETSLKPYNSYRVLTKSGKRKWIDQFSKEIQYKGRPAELVTIVDITEKKEVELELIKLSNLKSELLRRTSHELKTPLVSIKGFSDLLLELHRDKLDTYVIRTIKQIKLGCNRLESLVNDILKTAELESGTVELKKSKEDLTHLIKMCVSELEGLSELRNHIIHLDMPDNIICSFEKEQMHKVISNILNNAIKYTPINGTIEIKMEIKNSFIIISINDNGLGFTEEEKTRIFKQFGKIERYGQGYDVISEGSGLGLYISKKIVELHGGNIWVESNGRNKGSTFIINFPIA